MANADRPRGAVPVRHLTGGNPFSANTYSVDSSNGTAIFIGDFVILENDGNAAPYTGTGGGNLLGVCIGKVGAYNDLTQRYLPASTAGTILVVDDPDVVFEVQENGAMAATEVGTNCDIEAGAGSTTTGLSAHEIKSSTTTASAAQLRLLRLVDRSDNAAGTNAKWEVVINEHLFKSTSGI